MELTVDVSPQTFFNRDEMEDITIDVDLEVQEGKLHEEYEQFDPERGGLYKDDETPIHNEDDNDKTVEELGLKDGSVLIATEVR